MIPAAMAFRYINLRAWEARRAGAEADREKCLRRLADRIVGLEDYGVVIVQRCISSGEKVSASTEPPWADAARVRPLALF